MISKLKPFSDIMTRKNKNIRTVCGNGKDKKKVKYAASRLHKKAAFFFFSNKQDSYFAESSFYVWTFPSDCDTYVLSDSKTEVCQSQTTAPDRTKQMYFPQ